MNIEQKRQEIDKLLDHRINRFCADMSLVVDKLNDGGSGEEYINKFNLLKQELREDIKDRLSSQGVAIKVDKELPERKWFDDWGGASGKDGYETCYSDVMMAGGSFFEPLIEDKETENGS